MKTVFDILTNAAEQWPDNTAIIDEKGKMNFLELKSEAEKVKKCLSSKNIGKGHLIAVMAKNSREFIIGIFGALGTGAAVMPLSNQLKKNELESIIHEAGIHVILTDGTGLQHTFPKEICWSGTNGSLSITVLSNPTQPFAPHVTNPAFIRFSSGTTGKSKGVIIEHDAVLERVEEANKVLKLEPGNTVVWVLPMAYHFIVSIVLYIRFGAATAIAKDFLGKTIIDLIVQHRATLLYASPMHIRMLASYKEPLDFSALKMVISTSASVPVEACTAFYEKYGIGVSQAYGIIEIGLPIINHKSAEDYPESVGHAVGNYKVEILDEAYNVLPPDQEGKLGIIGPGMFSAYLNPPTPKEVVLKNGWFLTGDRAIKSKDGRITVKGREKSMINVSGNKVFPEDVEQVINAHPAVLNSKVAAAQHALMGEIVEAKILLKEGMDVSTEEILNWCRQRLTSYKVPQSVIFVEYIPITGSGKVVRYDES